MKRGIQAEVDSLNYEWIRYTVRATDALTVSDLVNEALSHYRNNVSGRELKLLDEVKKNERLSRSAH